MRKSDLTCPKCGAGYRRVELESKSGAKGEFRCLTCNEMLEVLDGSTDSPSGSLCSQQSASTAAPPSRPILLPTIKTSSSRALSGLIFPPCSTALFLPCIPTRAITVPTGALWAHKIKHDGYRLIVHRDGPRVRLFTGEGFDWSDRYPLIIEAAKRLKPHVPCHRWRSGLARSGRQVGFQPPA